MVRMSCAALAVAAALAAALAGCSTPPANPNDAPYEAKEYRTGSNIPVRDRAASSDVTAVKPDAMNNQRPFGLPGGGTPARP